MILTLNAIVDMQSARRPALSRAGFVSEFYALPDRKLRRMLARARTLRLREQALLALRMHAAHVRLFPGESIEVDLGNGSIAHIGAGGLFITFPDAPSQLLN